jgi:hypothetical protein
MINILRWYSVQKTGESSFLQSSSSHRLSVHREWFAIMKESVNYVIQEITSVLNENKFQRKELRNHHRELILTLQFFQSQSKARLINFKWYETPLTVKRSRENKYPTTRGNVHLEPKHFYAPYACTWSQNISMLIIHVPGAKAFLCSLYMYLEPKHFYAHYTCTWSQNISMLILMNNISLTERY